MKTAAETARDLRIAKGRIEQGWCQGVLARDGHGEEITPNHPAAVAWCAFGAIGTKEDALSQADLFLMKAHGPNTDVVSWNDAPERTREDVLALFDKAIALAESEAAA